MSQFSDEIDVEFRKWTAMMLDKKDAEITRLRADLAAVTAERDRMREALRPFADAVDIFIAENHDAHRTIVTLGDFFHARAALEGVTEPASPWRDIESAPKDGTAVVGCSTYKNKSGNLCYNWIADGYFDERGDWYFANSDFAECADPDVTDWMPLPEPPR